MRNEGGGEERKKEGREGKMKRREEEIGRVAGDGQRLRKQR